MKRLKLTDLKVKSFVTDLTKEQENTVRGGKEKTREKVGGTCGNPSDANEQCSFTPACITRIGTCHSQVACSKRCNDDWEPILQ